MSEDFYVSGGPDWLCNALNSMDIDRARRLTVKYKANHPELHIVETPPVDSLGAEIDKHKRERLRQLRRFRQQRKNRRVRYPQIVGRVPRVTDGPTVQDLVDSGQLSLIANSPYPNGVKTLDEWVQERHTKCEQMTDAARAGASLREAMVKGLPPVTTDDVVAAAIKDGKHIASVPDWAPLWDAVREDLRARQRESMTTRKEVESRLAAEIPYELATMGCRPERAGDVSIISLEPGEKLVPWPSHYSHMLTAVSQAIIECEGGHVYR